MLSGADAFTADRVSAGDRDVVLLAGEFDLAAATSFEASGAAMVNEGRPLDIDCSALSFIDCRGVGPLVRALENPQICLTNVPAHMSRVLRITGLSQVVRHRTRFDIAVVTADGFDAACAEQIVSVFSRANSEGCAYHVVWLPAERTASRHPLDHPRFHCLVVPPLDRWLGLSAKTALVRHVHGLAARSDRIIGVGTGLAVLAAAGLLDGRRIVALEGETGLAALTPRSTLCTMAMAADGPLATALDAEAACAHCVAIIADDYGEGLLFAHVEPGL